MKDFYPYKELLLKIMRNVYCEGCEQRTCKGCIIEQIIEEIEHLGGKEAKHDV